MLSVHVWLSCFKGSCVGSFKLLHRNTVRVYVNAALVVRIYGLVGYSVKGVSLW